MEAGENDAVFTSSFYIFYLFRLSFKLSANLDPCFDAAWTEMDGIV